MKRFYRWLYIWALKQWRKSEKYDLIMRKEPKLSQHALYRYAERIDGYDFEKATNALMTAEVKQTLSDIGGSGKFTHNGIVYTANEGVVVSVAKAEGQQIGLTYQPLDGETGRTWSF